MTISRPTANPVGDLAMFAMGSGWTIQSNVNANDPNTGTSGPQGLFTTYSSGALSPDVWQADVAPVGEHGPELVRLVADDDVVEVTDDEL